MKKSVCQIFNKNCLETGLKPNIPTINAATLEYVKRFPLFNVPAVAFSDSDFDETIAAYLPYPIVKVVPLGRTPVESKKIFPSIADCVRLLNAYAQGEQKLYNELEDRFMKPSKIASRRQFMETVIAWAFIFFYLKIRRDHRYFTALSFLLSSHTLLSYVNRFEFILQDKDVTPEEAEEMQSRRIWRTLSVLKDPILLNPHLKQFLGDLAPHVHKEEFPMVALELIPKLYDSAGEHKEKIDSYMNGALDDFAKQYAAESGVSLSNPSSAVLNKNRGISKGRASGYGMDIPIGISNKDFIYAFVDVVSLMSFVVKRRFGLKNKVSALFVLYTLQHLPFFNLQTDFRNIKTSKLWPVLMHKDGQTSVTAAPGPLVHFSTASLVGHGPFDYQGWVSKGCPKNLAPFNTPKGFQKDARKSLRQLNQCCNSFLKSFLHYQHMPIFAMLTSGPLEESLSPDPSDASDKRPIWDMESLVKCKGVLYVNLDSLSDNMIASAVGSMLLSDLTAYAGKRYNLGLNDVRISLYVDEASNVINQPLIELLNKGAEGGVYTTIAIQTVPDLAHRLGSVHAARMVLGNCNNLIALRCKDRETQDFVTETFGKTYIHNVDTTLSTHADTHIGMPSFKGGASHKRTAVREEIIPSEYLGKLPNAQFFASLGGGHLMKGRVPVIIDDEEN